MGMGLPQLFELSLKQEITPATVFLKSLEAGQNDVS